MAQVPELFLSDSPGCRSDLSRQELKLLCADRVWAKSFLIRMDIQAGNRECSLVPGATRYDNAAKLAL